MIVYPKTRSWLNLFSFYFFFFFLLQDNSCFCFPKTKKLEEKKLNQLSRVQSKLSNSRTRSQKIQQQQNKAAPPAATTNNLLTTTTTTTTTNTASWSDQCSFCKFPNLQAFFYDIQQTPKKFQISLKSLSLSQI